MTAEEHTDARQELQRLKDEGKYIRISDSEDRGCGEPEPDERLIRQ